jgi:hypothetical protein
MRIQEFRRFELFMNVEEFELFYEITSNVGYNYTHTVYADDEEYKVILFEYTMDECYELLKERADWELYEECNRMKSDRIRDLINEIYYEVYR